MRSDDAREGVDGACLELPAVKTVAFKRKPEIHHRPANPPKASPNPGGFFISPSSFGSPTLPRQPGRFSFWSQHA